MSKSRRIVTILISLLGAVILWLYVVTNVATEVTIQLDLPISLEGINVNEDGMIIQDGRMLKITEQSDNSTTVGIRTSRVSKAKLNNDSVRAVIEARSLVLGGSMSLPCVISFPETVHDAEIISKSVDKVSFSVVEFDERSISIDLDWTGDVQQGYYFDSEKVVMEPSELHIIGPKKELDRIARAVVRYDISELQETVTETVPVILLDQNGQELSFTDLTTISPTEIELTLPMLRSRELTLNLKLLEGGGVREENAKVELEPASISVKGPAELIDQLNETFVLDTVDLSSIPTSWEQDYALNLPEGVTSISGETSVHATIRLTGARTTDVDIDDIQLINESESYEVTVMTQVVRVKVRGETEEIQKMNESEDNGFYILVDLAGQNKTGSYPVRGEVKNRNNNGITVTDDYKYVNIDIQVTAIETTEPEPGPEPEQ